MLYRQHVILSPHPFPSPHFPPPSLPFLSPSLTSHVILPSPFPFASLPPSLPLSLSPLPPLPSDFAPTPSASHQSPLTPISSPLYLFPNVLLSLSLCLFSAIFFSGVLVCLFYSLSFSLFVHPNVVLSPILIITSFSHSYFFLYRFHFIHKLPTSNFSSLLTLLLLSLTKYAPCICHSILLFFFLFPTFESFSFSLPLPIDKISFPPSSTLLTSLTHFITLFLTQFNSIPQCLSSHSETYLPSFLNLTALSLFPCFSLSPISLSGLSPRCLLPLLT